MTLGFSEYWPDKRRTLFPEKIQLPYVQEIQKHFPDMLPKIHTFREGHRWRAGMKIHMVTSNRTPQRYQFNTDIAELQTCISTQDAVAHLNLRGILEIYIGEGSNIRALTAPELLLFAVNDGFNSVEEMTRWFFPKGKTAHIAGQIIHWTSFRYNI